jgi:hypothetical protein
MIIFYITGELGTSSTIPSGATATTNFDIAYETNLEDIIPKSFIAYAGDFIKMSGKIYMAWNNWYDKYMIWRPPILVKPHMLFVTTFIRRFQGNNQGRHWNRKPIK